MIFNINGKKGLINIKENKIFYSINVINAKNSRLLWMILNLFRFKKIYFNKTKAYMENAK